MAGGLRTLSPKKGSERGFEHPEEATKISRSCARMWRSSPSWKANRPRFKRNSIRFRQCWQAQESRLCCGHSIKVTISKTVHGLVSRSNERRIGPIPPKGARLNSAPFSSGYGHGISWMARDIRAFGFRMPSRPARQIWRPQLELNDNDVESGLIL
jgi:hypothetical protein